jgi:hypothetical protein
MIPVEQIRPAICDPQTQLSGLRVGEQPFEPGDLAMVTVGAADIDGIYRITPGPWVKVAPKFLIVSGPCKAATIGPASLAGLQFNGVLLPAIPPQPGAGPLAVFDEQPIIVTPRALVFVKDQEDQAQNGIYSVSVGRWARRPDWTYCQLHGAGVSVFVLLNRSLIRPIAFERVPAPPDIFPGMGAK